MSQQPASTQTHKDFKRRARRSACWIVLFYLAYVAFTVFCGYNAYRAFRVVRSGGNKVVLGLFVLVANTLILYVLVRGLMRVKRAKPPEHAWELTADEQPRLVALIHEVADSVGAKRPKRVFLTPDVNAAVTYDIGFREVIFPKSKSLILGMGLLEYVTEDELKAVLAHEFGHFTQKEMRLGRWVYLASQSVAQVVQARTLADSALGFISRVDLRVACIGWILRIIVWSARSVTDTLFRLVVRANRRLSQEMEFHADRVAVSIVGSDSITHGLKRSYDADSAMGLAIQEAMVWSQDKELVGNLYSLSRAIRQAHDSHYGVDQDALNIPDVPVDDDEAAAHRVFTPGLAQTPKMWATHPENYAREERAKNPYVRSELSNVPAHNLLEARVELQEHMTRAFYLDHAAGLDIQVEAIRHSFENKSSIIEPGVAYKILSAAEYEKRLSEGKYAKHVHRRYREVYDFFLLRFDQELASFTDAQTTTPAADYDDELAADVQKLRQIHTDILDLDRVMYGGADFSDALRLKDNGIDSKKDVPDALIALEAERDSLQQILLAKLKAIHGASYRKAKAQSDALAVRVQNLLHTAATFETLSARLSDDINTLGNLWQWTTADDDISRSELKKLVRLVNSIHGSALETTTWARDVVLDPELEALLRREWLKDPNEEDLFVMLDFGSCSKEDVGAHIDLILNEVHPNVRDFYDVIRAAALDMLLELEEAIDAGTASVRPEHQAASTSYPSVPLFRREDERPKLRKLAWWDRFRFADGAGWSFARASVTVSILGALFVGGSYRGDITVHLVYDGALPITVVTERETVRFEPDPGRSELVVPSDIEVFQARLDLVVPSDVEVFQARVERDDGEDETFDEELPTDGLTYIVNAFGQANIFEVTNYYGDDVKPETFERMSEHFIASPRDAFEEFPDTISTRSSSGSRTIIFVLDDFSSGLAGEFKRKVFETKLKQALTLDEQLRTHWLLGNARAFLFAPTMLELLEGEDRADVLEELDAFLKADFEADKDKRILSVELRDASCSEPIFQKSLEACQNRIKKAKATNSDGLVGGKQESPKKTKQTTSSKRKLR